MTHIFLHGLGQTASSWDGVITELSIHDVYCPELMISGQSYDELYQSFVHECMSLQRPLHLCGLSLGAVMALQYASDYPDDVQSLVLLAPQYKPSRFLLSVQHLLLSCLPNHQAMARLTRSLITLDLSERINNVSCETLIVCGTRDFINRRAARRLALKMKKARLHFLCRGGHEMNKTAPKQVARLIKELYRRNVLIT